MWPIDFPTVPIEDWTELPLEELAMKYDTVEEHGWYDNLDHTVDQIVQAHGSEAWVLDYSGGTGILSDRILKRAQDAAPNLLIVDSSPKFLRLALEKLKDNPKVAYRLIRYLKSERRLEQLDEVLPELIYKRGMDSVVSTNAVHLYYRLSQTVKSWYDVLKSDGHVFVQSGNIRNPESDPNSWIIDETVGKIHEMAMRLVQEQDEYKMFRPMLNDAAYMAVHDNLRNKYFIPVRPLSYYRDALLEVGFQINNIEVRSIQARVDQWYGFLEVYHEGVLGWVGGAQKITGKAISEETLALRKELIWRSMQRIFDEQPFFEASWTYITAQKK
ncbi:MAG: hypothetical protein CMK59_08665 [Proteobacteria bacterium]|nr:hypothetical protein [Pseudomonadota bacterium]